MTEAEETPVGGRVVVLSPAQSGIPEPAARGPWQWVTADSPYEAAAELLARPALALVLDLRSLPPRHIALLDIARRLHVEVLIVGVLPGRLDADRLRGLRLTGASGLANELHRLASAAAPSPPPPAATAAPTTPRMTAAPDKQPPPSKPAAPAAKPERPSDGEWAPQAKDGAQPQTLTPGPLSQLLTNEEFDALMEDRP